MGIDYNALAIPKGPSRYATKAAEQATLEKHQREVYAAVTKRDESCCRVCGQWRNPRAFSMLARLHHHHLIYRSQNGPTESWNLVCLCSRCHAEEHDGKLQLSGNADERDPDGKLCGLKVERPGETGWTVVAWT